MPDIRPCRIAPDTSSAFAFDRHHAESADLRPRPKAVEQTVETCECMIDIASALFNVCGKELRRPGRSALGVARVRQIAMYVTHVVMGLSMSDVGRGFGRDRTTVLHACHLIEDMRDDAEFDAIVAMAERVARAALRHGGRA